MTAEIKKMAPSILNTIKQSKKILLHCHPYPDPDSIGSVLAMTSILKKMNKDVVSIIGDSKYPDNFISIPNHGWIQNKNYSQINLKDFDLFIILDSSSLNQISQLTTVVFPKNMKTIVIDHHKTNQKFGDVNLIDQKSSSTSQILYTLFKLWGVEINPDTAICLFLGMFADTGGFKYQNTSSETLKIASELVKVYPNYHKFIFELENSRKPIELEMMGLALSSLEKYFSGNVVFSIIPYKELQKRGISREQAMEGLIGDTLKSVAEWNLVASLVEAEANIVTVSLRTRDEEKIDVSKIAKSVGKNGGGHKGAAGTTINASLNEAKKTLIDTIVELYPELKQDKQ